MTLSIALKRTNEQLKATKYWFHTIKRLKYILPRGFTFFPHSEKTSATPKKHQRSSSNRHTKEHSCSSVTITLSDPEDAKCFSCPWLTTGTRTVRIALLNLSSIVCCCCCWPKLQLYKKTNRNSSVTATSIVKRVPVPRWLLKAWFSLILFMLMTRPQCF